MIQIKLKFGIKAQKNDFAVLDEHGLYFWTFCCFDESSLLSN